MKPKIVYYKDELHDDFAGNNIKTKALPEKFRYVHRNLFWLIAEFLLYRVIATPIVWLIAKIGFGLRFENRKALKKLRGTGYYMYGNHTQAMMDAYIPALAAFPQRAHILTGPDAFSIPGISHIVQMLGGMPLSDNLARFREMMEALELRVKQKRVIGIYPEAHIWPWYTGIRPFADASFSYPVKQNLPVVAFVTTYRKRKIFKNLWPCITVTFSEPFFPDPALSNAKARRVLRDQAYGFMCERAARADNYVYREYRKIEENGSSASCESVCS